MKELARLWPKAINQPVVVLHPMLFVAQQPVVKSDQFRGEMMRFFDSAHHADGVRFTFHKTFDPRNDRRRRRAMTAAGVRRDDENFWSVGVHLVAQTNSLRYAFTAIPSGCSSTCDVSARAAFFISRS